MKVQIDEIYRRLGTLTGKSPSPEQLNPKNDVQFRPPPVVQPWVKRVTPAPADPDDPLCGLTVAEWVDAARADGHQLGIEGDKIAAVWSGELGQGILEAVIKANREAFYDYLMTSRES